ncbi:DUF2203 domain-containing protein [bacterium]|nr:DUF2203 domain-containing protein [bacterium]
MDTFPKTENLKIFTLEEAQKTLPYVKKIIDDLQILAKRFQFLSKKIKEEVRTSRENKKIQELKSQIEDLEGNFTALLEELDKVGCVSKGALSGLVDWLAIRPNGEKVWLCWMLGEKEIGFWHSIKDGFSSRKSLAEF